jgi:putative transposase
MSFVKIWVHVVFSTKYREPSLTKDILYQVKRRIMQNCKQGDIYLQSINGHLDHLHCLVSLGKEQTIASIVKDIKGASAFWLNENFFLYKEFLWQDDYFAISVSESQVQRVVNYIKNQENHHKNQTFIQEINMFNDKFGTQPFKDM